MRRRDPGRGVKQGNQKAEQELLARYQCRLIRTDRPCPNKPKLDGIEGSTQKRLGLKRVEASNAVFIKAIRERAKIVSRRRGWVVIDDLRVWAKLQGLAPKHPNAWGAIFHEPGWRAVGTQPSEIVSNHGRLIRRWTWSI